MNKENLYQRILAVQAECGAIAKLGRFPGQGNWAFHKIDDIVEALRPLFVANGIVCATRILRTESSQSDGYFFVEQDIEVRVINADNPEEILTITAMGHGLDKGDKAPGKAYSYALKTAYLALFNLRGQPDSEADDHLPPQNIKRQAYPLEEPPKATKSQITALTAYRNDPRCAALVKDGVSVQAKLIAMLAGDGPSKKEASDAIGWLEKQFPKEEK